MVDLLAHRLELLQDLLRVRRRFTRLLARARERARGLRKHGGDRIVRCVHGCTAGFHTAESLVLAVPSVVKLMSAGGASVSFANASVVSRCS